MKKTLFSRFLAPFVASAMIALAPSGMLMAQDSKIETGIVAFQSGDYKKAVEALKVGLSNTAEVKPKNLPRGYYHLGMANFQLMQQTAQAAQQAGNLEAKAGEISAMLDEAYTALLEARKTDLEGKWTDKVNKSLNVMYYSFVNGAVMGLNEAAGNKMSPEEKQEAFTEVIKFAGRCIEIDNSGYLPYDLRGQAYMAKKDTASAYTDFKSAVEKFNAKAPERPDIFVAYTYWRMALIERYNKGNLDMALASVDKGKQVLDKEYARIQAMKDNYKPEDLAKIQVQYQEVQQDLSNFELDILLNAPAKLKDALAKFDAATAKEPNNYVVHVAYAQLLEKVDTLKAIGMYEKATKIDDKNALAFFNLGALYVNLGVAKYKSANAVEKNIELAKKLQEEGDGYYRKAFPNLSKALELKPCDHEAMNAILNICINLSSDETMMAEYTKYKKIKADCGG